MVQVQYMWFVIFSEYHTLEVVFTRQKERADANPESPPRTQPEINVSEVRTTSWTFFVQEQNEISVQQVFNTLRITRVEI